jgi:hypothetical protein
MRRGWLSGRKPAPHGGRVARPRGATTRKGDARMAVLAMLEIDGDTPEPMLRVAPRAYGE